MFDFLKRKTKKEEELDISEFDILTNNYNTIMDEIVDIQKDIVKQNEAIEEQNKLLESIMKKVDNNDIELKTEKIIKALEGLEPTKLKPLDEIRVSPFNKTGVNRLSYSNNTWKYQYKLDNGKLKSHSNVDLNKLERIVKSKGLAWNIIDEDLYNQCKKLNHPPTVKKSKKKSKKKSIRLNRRNKTGINKVCYIETGNGNWRYQYYDENKIRKNINNSTLNGLEKTVKSKGLPWDIIDEDLYNQCKKLNHPPKDDNNIIKTKANEKNTHKSMGKNPNDKYKFPDSYRKEINFKLGKDGLLRSKKNTYESYELTYLFSNVDFPVLNKDYDKVCHIIDNLSFAKPMGMAVVYTLQKQLSGSGGKLLDLIFEIFKNDFEVPFFIDFGYDKDNDQLLINGGAVGISKKQLKIWVDELNDSFAPEFTILKIMQRTKSISKKYLFWTLMNYGNQHILDIIKK